MHCNKNMENSKSKRVKLKGQVTEIPEKLKQRELVNTERLLQHKVITENLCDHSDTRTNVHRFL